MRKQSRWSYVPVAVEAVHLVADSAQRITGAAIAVRRIHGRQHVGHRHVAVPETLELDELCDQRIELALVLRGIIRKRMLLRSHFSGTMPSSRR